MILLSLERMKIISNSQQTDITNNVIDTNTQTTNYIDENYLNNNKKKRSRNCYSESYTLP